MEIITENYPALIGIIGALVIVTNIIVEVLKKFVPNSKFPTNIIVLIVSMALTLAAFFAWAEYKHITVLWYYVVAAVVIGLFVCYAAMFGFDKLKETLKLLKNGSTEAPQVQPGPTYGPGIEDYDD